MTQTFVGLGSLSCRTSENFGVAEPMPQGPPLNSLFLLHVPANNHFSASGAPPGFSCPCFIHFMKITVFITIVTANGLLNFMIF